jgi:peptidyl-prolyl cis-trans isomerase-like 2
VRIIRHQDPFEEYKQRLAKRLERQALGPAGLVPSDAERKRASGAGTGNWFGESIKPTGSAAESTTSAGSGVGKYLKRTREAAATGSAPAEEPSQKKRKAAGWGDFAGW